MTKIYITVEGGVVQGVYSYNEETKEYDQLGIEVILRDYDVEGGDSDGPTIEIDENGDEYFEAIYEV